MTGSSPNRLYIYGLMNERCAPSRDALGEGVGGSAVRLERAGEIAALVSDIPDGPIAQTRRNMVAHTVVLERALARTDVLPLRFGTVVPDTATFVRCVAANANEFGSAFRDIGDRVELGLKASWLPGVAYAEIIAADADLRRVRDRLRGRPPKEVYFEQVELGRRVAASLADLRKADTASILSDLAPLADRQAELRLLDDDMILNRAFLVRRENETRFDSLVSAIAARCAERISFRYVGPVPPYNFVQLRVGWLTGTA